MVFDREELTRRLLYGESLEVLTDEGGYDVWVEPYVNPPVVYYEGRIFTLQEVERVIGALLDEWARGAIRCRWLEPRGVQEKSCAEAYRVRTSERPEGFLASEQSPARWSPERWAVASLKLA